MKIIYEFNTETEKYDELERTMFEIASDMYLAICDIQEYMRDLYKGYKKDDLDKIIETVNELIVNSSIHKIR